MAYDETLAERVRARLRGRAGISERRMFGGLAFLLNGNMACGVQDDRLVLRLGPQGAAAALREPHTAPMDFTGKPLASMIYVEAAGVRDAAALGRWLDHAQSFVSTLAPRPAATTPGAPLRRGATQRQSRRRR